jgi:hypothetical protein
MPLRRDVLVRGVLVVAVTASLGLFAAGGDAPTPPAPAPALPGPAPAAAPAPRPQAKADALRHDLLRREAHQRPEGDAFAAHSWQPPPPPPPPVKKPVAAPEPAPEPPPAAPPLPFTFLGAFETEGAKQVFYLVEGDKLHAVTEGEIVNEIYQVETVTPEEMVLMYLPLKIRQTLALGGNK